jgi:hypothetical protein
MKKPKSDKMTRALDLMLKDFFITEIFECGFFVARILPETLNSETGDTGVCAR